MVTIKDVAKKAEVSIGTVDRVVHNRGRVSEETKKKVWQVIEELQYTPNSVAQGLASNKKRLTIGFCIPNEVLNPFFLDVRKAVEKRAIKLKQYGVTVKILTVTKYQEVFDEGYTVDVIHELDGVCTLGLNIGLWKKIIDKAHNDKVPIIIYNLIIPEYESMSYVGCNYEDSGRLAAGLAALIGGGDASVGVISQAISPHSSYGFRMCGFKSEMINRYPQMKILFESPIYEDRQDNYANIKELINNNPHLNVIYVLDPADYEVCRIIHELDPNHKLKVITNDLVGDQIDMVRDGIIDATICQEPIRQGEESLNMMFEYLAYGREPEHRVYTKLSIHIAQNVQ